MKAVVCKAWGLPETLVIEEQPEVMPAAGEIMIDIMAAGVNFPDVLIIQNKYQFKPELPFTPGNELAGIVRSVGEGVTKFKKGDRVFAFVPQGAFAQQIAVDEAAVLPMSEAMDFDTAAALTLTYGTSHHAIVDRAQLKAGETMLVLGAAGGVGLAAIEIGKAIGARVIAAASTDEKLAICKQHGADELINYSSEDLREAIKRTTGGKGPDVVYDPVGGKFSDAAMRGMAWKGRYLVVGFANGEIPQLPMNLPLLKGCSVVGVFWGQFAKLEPKASLQNTRQLLAWIQEGKIRQHVGKRYALAEAPQALQDLMDRKMLGKGVVLLVASI